MHNKLQELTDKLYNEGLSKGKQEGEEILAKAKIQAEETVAKAKAEADAIVAAARKEAEDLKTKVQGDLKMAAGQSIAATKKDIETLIVTKMTAEETAKALTSAEFVKGIIKAVAEGDKIQLTGFGTFEQRQRNARTGVDPRTGNSIEIPASKVPAFKAGAALKAKVAE